MTITKYKWTIDRYYQAVEAGVFNDQPVELLNGELIETVSESVSHAGLSDSSSRYLQRLLGERAIVRVGHPITLPNNSEPEPDLANTSGAGNLFVEPLEDAYSTEHHPYPENIFWLIEYSNTSLDKDLQVKSKVYAEVNIAEYWVVNLELPSLQE